MRYTNAAFLLVLVSLPVAAWEVRNTGGPVNTEYHEAFSAITPDGLTIYISSDRPGGYGIAKKGIFMGDASFDIDVSHRENLDSPWGPVVNLGVNINTNASEHSPMVSRDGHYLYFMSDRSSGFGGADIYRSYREDITDDLGWGTAENLGEGVNGPNLESCPVLYESDDEVSHLFYAQASGPGLDTIDFDESDKYQAAASAR